MSELNEFYFYFNSGVLHILNFNKFAYVLFVCLLCARYRPWETRQLFLTLAAFTVGHSVSLFLCSVFMGSASLGVVNTLIFVTILITAISNVLLPFYYRKTQFNYILIGVFGIIHGIGFSGFFNSLWVTRHENHLLANVFAFNLGLELGQLFIIGGFMLMYFTYLVFTNRSHTFWCISSSIFITLMFSILMII